MATAILGRELQLTREVLRLAYGVGLEADRADLLKKLRKKRKYRKVERPLRTLIGLALTLPRDESDYLAHRRAVEKLHKS